MPTQNTKRGKRVTMRDALDNSLSEFWVWEVDPVETWGEKPVVEAALEALEEAVFEAELELEFELELEAPVVEEVLELKFEGPVLEPETSVEDPDWVDKVAEVEGLILFVK